MRDPTISFFCARARACVATLAALASLTGCPMQIPAASQTGYQEFYTCVARVSDLPRFIALSKQPGAPFTEAQVRAYYAQFPIGKTDTDGAPCYAQHWRIPNAVSVAAIDGYEGELQLAFPLGREREKFPADGIIGLGTADVGISNAAGRIPGDFIVRGGLLSKDGSVRYDAAKEKLVHDRSAGYDLIIQRNCPDVGGKTVSGLPVNREDDFDFRSEIACGSPEAFSSLQGIKMNTNLDDRFSVNYYIWPEHIANARAINLAIKTRIKKFLIFPREVRSITSDGRSG